MISLNRPPFNTWAVIVSFLTNQGRKLESLEAAYADAAGCSHAVWLPTARAGICWALRASIAEGTTVFGPAFTCGAVHEAMVRSGGKVEMVDAKRDDFLMCEESIVRAQRGDYALVLSELYGHSYDIEYLAGHEDSAPKIRIVDMAMGMPHPNLFKRLRPNDFAVISFGRGKCMFAGWGAMALTSNQALAGEVRRQRDSVLVKGGAKLLLQRTAQMYFRTLAQNPVVYPFARALRTKVEKKQAAVPAGTDQKIGFPSAWADDALLPSNWKHPSTGLDRNLDRWNLERVNHFRQVRLALARRYHDNLEGFNHITRPRTSQEALSHYTVRVEPSIRPNIQARLQQSGALWDFYPYLDKNVFPNAFRMGGSVLNLPLSPWMSLHDVDHTCDILVRSVDDCMRNSNAKLVVRQGKPAVGGLQ